MPTDQDLGSRVAELEAKLEAGVAQADELRLQVTSLTAERDGLENQIGMLQAKLRVIGTSSKESSKKNDVVLGGVKHVIVEQGRMLDLVDQWRKRFIEDGDLILVVKKA